MKKKIQIAIILLVVFFFVFRFFYTKNEVHQTAFEGVIEFIEYDGKSQPTVTINGCKYGFPFAREKGELLIGDSLVKKKNTYRVIQYRDGEKINIYEEY